MNAQHTPGPWVAKREDGKYRNDHDWNVSDDADSVCVSEAAPIWGGNQVVAFAVASSNLYQREFPHVDANARLIAAAPELLQALRHVEGALLDITCERTSILKGVRAAIAKATGGGV